MTPVLLSAADYELRYPGIGAALAQRPIRAVAREFSLPVSTVIRIAARCGVKKPVGRPRGYAVALPLAQE